ncbi:hypothetical protein [Rhodococcus sp. 27YEA15]|uniref:hypothetical protein n=1 Tax=Rhodococcus sp. 27YEA15 TaxID=3156259 RepID=UPI003C7D6817
MSVRPDSQTTPPTWKVVAVLVAVVTAATVALVYSGTGRSAVLLGIVMALGGAALTVMSERRILRENAGRRMSLFGSPPVRPRRFDLLSGAGVPLLMFGSAISVQASTGPRPYLLLGVLATATILAMTFAYIVHNRRISQVPEA